MRPLALCSAAAAVAGLAPSPSPGCGHPASRTGRLPAAALPCIAAYPDADTSAVCSTANSCKGDCVKAINNVKAKRDCEDACTANPACMFASWWGGTYNYCWLFSSCGPPAYREAPQQTYGGYTFKKTCTGAPTPAPPPGPAPPPSPTPPGPRPPTPPVPGTTTRTVVVDDPELGPVNRTFLINIPPSATGPMPLLLGFHGQGDAAKAFARAHSFDALARADGWVTVYPEGMADGSGGGDAGWNIGDAGDESVCVAGTTNTDCHKSCKKLGRCGRCNWAPCYDDVAFVSRVLDVLGGELCLDAARYFAVGNSNGGMMVHYLAQELPGTFRGVVSGFGHPEMGYIAGRAYQLVTQRAAASRTSLMQFHGRSDPIIPWGGGQNQWGWIYEAGPHALGVWAAVHGCAPSPTPFATPLDNTNDHMACAEYTGCSSGGRVARCLYDGGHDWPRHSADSLVWAFFANTTK